MKTYIAVYLGSAFIGAVGMPFLARLARRKGWVDKPGLRRIHTRPVPRVGGIMIELAAFALIVPVFLLDNVIGDAFRNNHVQIGALLFGSVLVFGVGLLDDLRNVTASVKLLALIGASLLVCASGARITTISFGSVVLVELGWFSWIATVLWIVAVTVGMNFIDGMDGLAGGIAAIVAAVIGIMAYVTGQVVMAVLMAALLGSLSAFLFFNFNPARIFMGDCGSMFLGFMIGAGSVVCVAKAATLVGIAVPALALGVPLLDAGFTMIRRGLLDRRSVFSGERGHIHHRLLDLGLRQRQAVTVLYGVTLIAAVVALALLSARRNETLLLAGGCLAFLLVVFHVLGVARLRETVRAIRRNVQTAHRRRVEKRCFEDAQLRVREATSFDGLWQATCAVADRMEFDHMAVTYVAPDETTCTVVWSRPSSLALPPGVECIRLTIPVKNGAPAPRMRVEAEVRPNGSVETVGRRMMILARLIDEWMARDGLSLGFTPPAAVEQPLAAIPVSLARRPSGAPVRV